MKLPKTTQLQYHEIWRPRYHDRKVLLAKFRVGTHNKIVFTKAPHMGTDPYYISGDKVQKFGIESNGKIECYAIPINELEPLEVA